MNKIFKIAAGLVIIITTMSSCEGLLGVDSDQLAFTSDVGLNSSNDTIYSMIGIFSRVEKLAERYVILGELRGDLMDITSQADIDLKEVYNFEISPENRYNKISDYYSVINNCNYLIQTVDTAIVASGEKVMYKQFAAAKAIRAWTYMQIALNYGKAKYYEEALLDVNKIEDSYPEYTLDQLAPLLIDDLSPWKDIQQPGNLDLGDNVGTIKLYFPIRMVLGDLYLWTGQYENAAREYHDLMVANRLLAEERYRNWWQVEGGQAIGRYVNWSVFTFDSGIDNDEQITLISGSTEFGEGSPLDSLTNLLKLQVGPSDVATGKWESQTYYHTNDLTFEGDLRGNMASYYSKEYVALVAPELNIETGYIYKYARLNTDYTKSITVNRIGSLYLKYAEAVNRLGKPNLAFATLKHGLGTVTMAVDTIVPRHEKYSSNGTFYSYTDFEGPIFNFSENSQYNIGIHARGCGNTQLAKEYLIPSLPSLQDSITWVEDQIVQEMALETAFEGNRFHDLMRIAKHRDDNVYLADKVAEKYPDKEVIRAKLLNESNWYLSK